MIRLLTDDKKAEFSAFCDKRITGAVIYTRLKAYGLFSNEAFFWYSKNDDGKINAVFSMTDGVILACTDGTADEEEISIFAQTVGASGVTYGNAEYTLKFNSSQKSGAPKGAPFYHPLTSSARLVSGSMTAKFALEDFSCVPHRRLVQ